MTWGVSTNGNIQSAIDAASAGDTINVAAGIYDEVLDAPEILIDKPLTLLGAQAGVDPRPGIRNPSDNTTESIIVGPGPNPYEGSCDAGLKITAANVTIDGFTVKETRLSGILLAGYGAHDCVIKNNIAIESYHNGICLEAGPHHNLIIHNIASSTANSTDGSGIGVVRHGDYNTIKENICENSPLAGIVMQAGNYNTIENNLCRNNYYGISLWHRQDGGGRYVYGGNHIVRNNTLTSNAYGIRINNSSSNTIEFNNIVNNNPDNLGFQEEVPSLDWPPEDPRISLYPEGYPGGIGMVELPFLGGEKVTGNVVRFNNITGNKGYGISNTANVTLDAPKNWWGDASGPDGPQGFTEDTTYTGLLPGKGDAVSANVWCLPWLTRPFETVAEDAIAYFGISTYAQKGWNIVSTPLALDQNVTADGFTANTWGGLLNLGKKASGDDYALKLHYTVSADTKVYTPIYYYDSDPASLNPGWRQATELTQVNPVDAYYLRMKEADSIPVLFSPDFSVPSKELYKGWNLVGYAYMPPGGPGRGEDVSTSLEVALKTIERVSSASGDVKGYAQVVSPSMNQMPWVYIPPAVAGGEGTFIGPGGEGEGMMVMGRGYWVFMENPGTLAGLTFTPMSFRMD